MRAVPSQGFQIFSDVIVEKRIGSALTSALMKTILVTAYPDDDVHARALNDGVVATFASLMRSISCGVFVRLSILISRTKRIHELFCWLGKVN